MRAIKAPVVGPPFQMSEGVNWQGESPYECHQCIYASANANGPMQRRAARVCAGRWEVCPLLLFLGGLSGKFCFFCGVRDWPDCMYDRPPDPDPRCDRLGVYC